MRRLLALLATLVSLAAPAAAQDLLVYDDQLRNGFEDWSWATHNLVVLPAAAVGEVVADLLDRLEWPMTPAIATNLWVSLVSDTGSFRYGCTTPRALALGARLVSEGVRPDVVNEFLYEARPVSTLKLEGLVLGTLELHDEGRVAIVSLPKSFLLESGADAAISATACASSRIARWVSRWTSCPGGGSLS